MKHKFKKESVHIEVERQQLEKLLHKNIVSSKEKSTIIDAIISITDNASKLSVLTRALCGIIPSMNYCIKEEVIIEAFMLDSYRFDISLMEKRGIIINGKMKCIIVDRDPWINKYLVYYEYINQQGEVVKAVQKVDNISIIQRAEQFPGDLISDEAFDDLPF